MAVSCEEEILASNQDEKLLYQTWQAVLSQPAIQQIDPDTAELIDTIAQIGYQYADSKYEYRNDISRYLFLWNEKLQSRNETSFEWDSCQTLFYGPNGAIKSSFPKLSLHSANVSSTHVAITVSLRKNATNFASPSSYTKDETSNFQVKSLEGRLSRYMKRTIPLSYATTFVIFLSLSFIFGFKFYIGLHGGNYLIGPWTNLMLLVAAMGLTITVLVACGEWRRWQRGFQKEGQIQKESKQKKDRG